MISPNWSSLLRQLVRRDLLRRFRGSLLGLGWTLVKPLVLLVAFQFAFRLVWVTRWPGAEGEASVALQVLLGALVFQYFAEILNRSPGLLQENPDLIRKVAFPRELLGMAATLTASIPLWIGLAIVQLGWILLGGGWSHSLILLPAHLACLFLSGCGLSWLLASTGVYLRDLKPGMQLASSLLMFLCPVFYPMSLVPPAIQPWVRLNPIANAIETTRILVLGGQLPATGSLVGGCLGSVLLATLGRWWFRKLSVGFSDVL